MEKITYALAILFCILPSVSSAAALTQQQSNSLIAVVQSSPGTPASAFVSLITAFSNITVNQATSLITVVQAAPGVPANAFVNLLTSFTVDTPTTQPATPAVAPQTTQTNQQTTQSITPTSTTAPTTPSASVTIPTITLSANPMSIILGQSVTISYQVTNATSCVASGGWSGTYNAPAGFTNAWSSDKGPFYPTQTTTYSLTCTGAAGSTTQNITINPTPSSWTINVNTPNGTTAQANVGTIRFEVSVQKDGAYVKQPITVTTNDPDLPSSFVVNAPFATQLATNGDVSANQFFCVAPLPPQYKISNGCPVENPVSVGTFDVTFTVENVSKTVQITVTP